MLRLFRRGKRACVWGSVYLDTFGEEDRDLKRGKPLFLSEQRYSVLEQQWISHSFDHVNKVNAYRNRHGANFLVLALHRLRRDGFGIKTRSDGQNKYYNLRDTQNQMR